VPIVPRRSLLTQLPGLHFYPKAYRIMYEELRALIAREWPDQTPESLGMVFPNWNDEPAWVKSGL
jgi:isoamyl acetate esterase